MLPGLSYSGGGGNLESLGFFLFSLKSYHQFWTEFYDGHVHKERKRERESVNVISLVQLEKKKKKAAQSVWLSKKNWEEECGIQWFWGWSCCWISLIISGNLGQTWTDIQSRSCLFQQSVISALLAVVIINILNKLITKISSAKVCHREGSLTRDFCVM